MTCMGHKQLPILNCNKHTESGTGFILYNDNPEMAQGTKG